MQTIKQISHKIGIDKQKVYRYIKKNRIKESHQKNGAMYYSDKAVRQITRHFLDSEPLHSASDEAHQTTSLDTIIDVLKSELEIKNQQISELNARLAESNAALVAAQQSAQAAQALHAGTMQKQLIDSEAVQETPADPPGFFSRLFSKR